MAINRLQLLATRSDRIGFDAKYSLKHGPTGRIPDSETRSAPRGVHFLPQPSGCSKAEAEEMIKSAFFTPDHAAKVVDLLRPAIRLWPKPQSGSPIGSRFGGLPAVPRDFRWPFADEEPFTFLAQINCAELGPLADAFGLPNRGLLSFFGDNADINGVPTNGGAVYFFDDHDGLAVRELPMPEDQPLISCGMGFYETWEVPDFFSVVVGALGITNEADRRASDSYFDLYMSLAQFGFEEEWSLDRNDISKLFGWPDLVQEDIYAGTSDRLLCQLGQHTDGIERNYWGPGGLLYFVIEPTALSRGDFSRAELIMQCT
jgi:uncharacterized protein YwqG